MKKLAVKSLVSGSLLSLLLAGSLFLTPAPVSAKVVCDCGNDMQATADQESNCPAACSKLAPSGGTSGGTTTAPTPSGGGLENPLSGLCAGAEGKVCVQRVIGSVIKGALGIVGSIALLMMTWGGFLWLTSMGSNEKVEKGKNTLIWATLGLVIVFGAYAITDYVIKAIQGQAGGGTAATSGGSASSPSALKDAGATCTSTSECKSGLSCDEAPWGGKACLAPGGSKKLPQGAACTSPNDCDSGLMCFKVVDSAPGTCMPVDSGRPTDTVPVSSLCEKDAQGKVPNGCSCLTQGECQGGHCNLDSGLCESQ